MDIFTYKSKITSEHRFDVRLNFFITFLFTVFSLLAKKLVSMCILFLLTFVYILLVYSLYQKYSCKDVLSIIKKVLKFSIPIYFLGFFSLLFNSFLFNGMSFQFSQSGFMTGLFYSSRLIMLAWISIFLLIDIKLHEFLNMFISFIRPISKFGINLDSVYMIVSLSLRLIPDCIDEFNDVKNAQMCRGASFNNVRLSILINSYISCLMPVIIRMFNKSLNLEQVLDARCFGIYPRQYEKLERINRFQLCSTFLFLIICIFIIIFI